MALTIPFEITVQELKQWMDAGKDFVLVDVREPNEYATANIGGKLIPLNTLPQHLAEFDPNTEIVVHCKMGGRSGQGCRVYAPQRLAECAKSSRWYYCMEQGDRSIRADNIKVRMNIRALAEQIGASAIELSRGDEEIICATGIEDGVPGAVTFIGNPLYERFLATTKATAVIVSEYLSANYKVGGGPVLLRVKNPYEGFSRALELFSPKKEKPPKGIHPSAVISQDVEIDPEAHIGAHVFVGPRAKIGPNTIIRHSAYIGADAVIGEDCEIHPMRHDLRQNEAWEPGGRRRRQRDRVRWLWLCANGRWIVSEKFHRSALLCWKTMSKLVRTPPLTAQRLPKHESVKG